LTQAFQEIGSAFEAQHPDVRVRLNSGASGALLQQIAKGAPVDVFASADLDTMAQAQQQKWVPPGAATNFASNTLVVIVPHDARVVPRTLADLATPPFKRVVMGVPASVPAGRYARAALQSAQLWHSMQTKTVSAQSVRQALDYVARGEVDAGFVYATDAALMPGKVKLAFTVPTDSPVRYAIAPVMGSPNAANAQKFIQYLMSPPAQAVLARFGFGAP
jgi:molybdate transport system substrate-binding protein